MTDSMKFGPEWLRNLSADSISATHASSSTTNGGGSGSGSGSLCHSSPNNNSLSKEGSAGNLSSGPSRSFFPEFRYGREEMLSLFEKNCDVPEILPCYKNLFVEKTQFPLAMTPCSDDETQNNPALMRTTWLQRSPSGFSNSNRGLGRGSSTERGRVRGKSTYHINFMRSSTFEDEQRTNVSRSERTWTDRNGSVDNSATVNNLEWNGIASPRREFPNNHSRNHENWRKIRIEEKENSIETPSLSDGWRNPASGNFISNNRWGRSTSWRDDEVSNIDYNSGTTLQRSQSSSNNVAEKSSNNFYGSQSNKNFSGFDCITNNVAKIGFASNSEPPKLMPTLNEPDKSNKKAPPKQSSDMDDLPEWATEHPSKEGGTFDALGAFHGNFEVSAKNSLGNILAETRSRDSDNVNTASNEKLNSQKPYQEDDINNKDKFDGEGTEHPEKREQCSSSKSNSSSSNFNNIERTRCCTENNIQNANVKCDISEQIREVTDDMIEKLIMDDDMGERVESSNTEMISQQSQSNPHMLLDYRSNLNGPETVLTSIVTEKDPLQVQNLIRIPTNDNTYVNNPLITQPNDQCSNIVDHHPPQMGNNIQSPKDLWFYRDPQSKVQGPFTAIEMTEWFKAGYFNETLCVRRLCDLRFRALGELIKLCNGNIPFTNNHLLPLDLDNYQPLNNMNFIPYENYEDLKGNVTAAADSVNSAIKNIISTVDMTNMLNIHFQMLQEQYISHQESLILSELSKNEFFQRLSKLEKEAVIRQRVRIPEYLSSLSGLSNSLAALNPTAGDQLYNTIAEYSKKDNVYGNFTSIPTCAQMLHRPELREELVNRHKSESINNSMHYEDMFLPNKNADCLNRKNFQADFTGPLITNDGSKMIPKYSEKTITDNDCMNIVNIFHEQNPISSDTVSNATLRTLWSSNLNNEIIKNSITQANYSTHNNQWNNDSALSIADVIAAREPEIKTSGWIQQNLESNLHQNSNNIQSSDEIEEETAVNQIRNEFTKLEQQQIEPQDISSQKSDTEQHSLVKKVQSGTKQDKNIVKKNIKSHPHKPKEDVGKAKDILEEKKKNEKKRDLDNQTALNTIVVDQDEKKIREKLAYSKNRKLQISGAQQSSANQAIYPKQQKEHSRIPSSVAPWSTQATDSSKGGPCLAEIQKAERREKRADQQRLIEQIHKIPNNATSEVVETYPKWNAPPVPVKSIAEIQAEEAKRLLEEQAMQQKKKELEQVNSAIINNTQINGFPVNSVWSGSKSWVSNMSIWEENQKNRVSESSVSPPHSEVKNSIATKTSNSQTLMKHSSNNNVSLKKSQTVSVMQSSGMKQSPPVVSKKSQVKENCESKKVGGVNKQRNPTSSSAQNNIINELENEFINWCLKALNSMNTIVDVPTFVSFLKDLDSPYEVKDYIRMYLGESRETNEFGKQFLERRSKYKNLQRAQNAHNDDMCKPAPALTPSLNDSNDSKAKNKKVKKNKMTKLDSRILGFSVTAAEGRINVGDRDYVDAP